uniref:Uncharacterized protein n=1 Tax=Nelumbo nucifera TaxID=4432 RepID=A0A822ZD50_NELNU|nr:TPA_asm: hypothetical protein HUJ06_001292 [Nelumbo nucifera]
MKLYLSEEHSPINKWASKRKQKKFLQARTVADEEQLLENGNYSPVNGIFRSPAPLQVVLGFFFI